MRLSIPDDQLLNGLDAPCLIDDITTLPFDVDRMIRHAEEWGRILRQQKFHLGLMDLFRQHPALVSLTINAEAASRHAKMTLFATPTVVAEDPKVQKKALRAVETSLGTLRGNAGTARTVISDVLRNMINRGPFTVTRDGIEDYLSIALGEDLYRVRHRWIENRVLRDTLSNVPAERAPSERHRL